MAADREGIGEVTKRRWLFGTLVALAALIALMFWVRHGEFWAIDGCLDCKKRSGSAFAVQARWPEAQVTVEGHSKTWSHFADSGHRITHHFCPECGSTVHYRIEGKFVGLVAIPLGAFDDPYFASPRFSVWEKRKHDWVEILGDVEHSK